MFITECVYISVNVLYKHFGKMEKVNYKLEIRKTLGLKPNDMFQELNESLSTVKRWYARYYLVVGIA